MTRIFTFLFLIFSSPSFAIQYEGMEIPIPENIEFRSLASDWNSTDEDRRIQLQLFFRDCGYYNTNIDGIYGPETERAILFLYENKTFLSELIPNYDFNIQGEGFQFLYNLYEILVEGHGDCI